MGADRLTDGTRWQISAVDADPRSRNRHAMRTFTPRCDQFLNRRIALARLGLLGSCILLGACLAPAAGTERSAPTQGMLFSTSAPPSARAAFARGVTLLHSFGYDRAREAFVEAREIDPDFALAYWGESLTYNHLLSAERDLDSPRRALLRLAPTRELRLAKANTDYERGFIRAAEALWMGSGTEQERRLAYLAEMQRLYESYPDDMEAASFYTLALLVAVGPLEDTSYRLNMRAGALALELLARDPSHPGAAHYTIHAFDDPVHAPLALPAARRYAEIAPDVSHALHMPSHIFMQLGMWDAALASNRAAFLAAESQWQPVDSPGDMFHAADWAQYAALQLGETAEAERWIAKIDAVIRRTNPGPRLEAISRRLRARLMIETQRWENVPLHPWATEAEALASGLAAAELGNLERAQSASDHLRELALRPASTSATFDRGNKPALIAEAEVQAMIAFALDDTANARTHLDRAIEIADTMGPPRGAAVPLKPPHELYGELLLRIGRPDQAIPMFRQSLALMPGRALSSLGLERAQRALSSMNGAGDGADDRTGTRSDPRGH